MSEERTKPQDWEIQQAAIAMQLGIAIQETLGSHETGVEIAEVVMRFLMADGKDEAWIQTALDAVDDIQNISFSKNEQQKWILVTKWKGE